MDKDKFKKNIKIGSACEERVSQYFKNKLYNVYNIGWLQLPADLLIWDRKITFLAEVKYRTAYEKPFPIYLNRERFLEIIEKNNLPIILIIEFEDKFYSLPLHGEIKLDLPIPKRPFPIKIMWFDKYYQTRSII